MTLHTVRAEGEAVAEGDRQRLRTTQSSLRG